MPKRVYARRSHPPQVPYVPPTPEVPTMFQALRPDTPEGIAAYALAPPDITVTVRYAADGIRQKRHFPNNGPWRPFVAELLAGTPYPHIDLDAVLTRGTPAGGVRTVHRQLGRELTADFYGMQPGTDTRLGLF